MHFFVFILTQNEVNRGTRYLFHADEAVVDRWVSTINSLIEFQATHTPTAGDESTMVCLQAIGVAAGRLFGAISLSKESLQLVVAIKASGKQLYCSEVAWQAQRKDVGWTPALLSNADVARGGVELDFRVMQYTDTHAAPTCKCSGSAKYDDIVSGTITSIPMGGKVTLDIEGVRTFPPLADGPRPIGDMYKVDAQLPAHKKMFFQLLDGDRLVYRSQMAAGNGQTVPWAPFGLGYSDVSPTTELTVEVCTPASTTATEHAYTVLGSCKTSLADVKITRSFFRSLKRQTKPDLPIVNAGHLFATFKGTTGSAADLTSVPSGTAFVTVDVACTKLAAMDGGLVGGNSDPYMVVKAARPIDRAAAQRRALKLDNVTDSDVPIYRTPVQKKNRSPTFTDVVLPVDACGGLDGRLTVELYDWDKDGTDDLIGTFVTTLRELSFGEAPFIAKTEATGTVSRGRIIISEPRYSEEAPAHAAAATLTLRFEKLASSLLDKTDPYVEVLARPLIPPARTAAAPQAQSGAPVPPVAYPLVPAPSTGLAPMARAQHTVAVARTAHQVNNRSPTFEVRLEAMACGGPDALITLRVMDFDTFGDDDLVGEFQTTYRLLTTCCADNETQFFLYDKAKTRKHRGRMYISAALPDSEAPWTLDAPMTAGLTITGVKLDNLDRSALRSSAKSDPFFVLARADAPDVDLYRSEVIMDDLNPAWGACTIPLTDVDWCQKYSDAVKARKKIMKQMAGRTDPAAQKWLHANLPRLPDIASHGLDDVLTVAVFDYEESGGHELIGSTSFTLRQVMAPTAPEMMALHVDGKDRPTGHIKVTDVVPGADPLVDPLAVTFTARGARIKSELLDKADPFLEARTSDGQLVYRSGVRMDDISPEWEDCVVRTAPTGIIPARCGFTEPLTWTLLDYDKDGTHDPIGAFSASLRDLTSGFTTYPLLEADGKPLQHTGLFKLAKKAVRRNNGVITFSSVAAPSPTVDDFLASLAAPSTGSVQVTVSASKVMGLAGVTGGGASSPMFVVYAEPRLPALAPASGKEQAPLYVPVYQSEVLSEATDPEWAPFSLGVDQCGGVDNAVIIEVFHATSAAYKPIGGIRTSLFEMTMAESRYPLLFKAADKTEKKSVWKSVRKSAFRNAGELHIAASTTLLEMPAAPTPLALAVEFSMKDVPRIEATKVDTFIRVTAYSQPTVTVDPAVAQLQARLGTAPSPAPPVRRPVEVYSSEVLMNDDNPTFRPVVLQARDVGGPDAPMLIEVLDWDSDGSHDRLGYATTTLRHLSGGAERLSLVITDKKLRKKRASLCLNINSAEPAEEAPPTLGLNVTLKATKLTNKDKLSLSDPFITVHALDSDKPYMDQAVLDALHAADVNPDGYASFHKSVKEMADLFHGRPNPAIADDCVIPLHRSEVKKNNLSPTWAPFLLPMMQGVDEPLLISVQDYDASGVYDLIGMTVITGRMLTPGARIVLRDPDAKSGVLRTYRNSGVLEVVAAEPLTSDTMPPSPDGGSITVTVDKVPRVDGLSKADPYIVVRARPLDIPLTYTPAAGEQRAMYSAVRRLPAMVDVVRTEHYRGKKSVTFRPFPLWAPECGGVDRLVRLELWDYETDGEDNLIGFVETTLRMLLTEGFRAAIEPKGHKRGMLLNRKAAGLITVAAEPAPMPGTVYSPPVAFTLNLAGRGLDKKDAFSSDPFVDIVATPAGCTVETVVYRSSVHRKALSPDFGAVMVTLRDVGGLYNTFKVRVSDWDADGTHDLIGQAETSLKTIMARDGQTTELLLINEEKKAKPLYRNSGRIAIDLKDTGDIAMAADIEPGRASMVQVQVDRLQRMDGPFGKADPVLQVVHENGDVLHQTEVKRNALQAVWRPFYLDLSRCGGLYAPLTIRVLDWDKDGSIDLIGELTGMCYRLITQPTMRGFPWPLASDRGLSRNAGVVSVVSNDPTPPRPTPVAVKIALRAADLPRMDTTGADPYLLVKGAPYRGASVHTVYRTETVPKERSPVWAPFTIDTAAVGSMFAPITLEVWDKDVIGADDLIGRCETTLQQLVAPEALLVLKGVGGLLRKNAGVITVTSADEITAEHADPAVGELVAGTAVSHPTAIDVTLRATKLDRKDVASKNDPFITVTGPAVSDPRSFAPVANPLANTALLPIAAAPAARVVPCFYSSEPSATHQILPSASTAAEPSAIMKRALDAGDVTLLRTPVQMDTSEPTFTLRLHPDDMGMDSTLTVTVWDWDKDGGHEPIGKVETSLREIVCPNTKQYKLARVGGGVHLRKAAGVLTLADIATIPDVVAHHPTNNGPVGIDMLNPEKAPPAPKQLRLKVKGADLLSTDLFSAADAFVQIVRQADGHVLATTEGIANSANPTWQPVEFDLDQLAGMHEKLDLRLLDHDRVTGDDPIGTVAGISVMELLHSAGHRFVIPMQRRRALRKNAGYLTLDAELLMP